jgi:hypothetical protein
MTQRDVRRIVLIGAAFAVAIALGACGGGGPEASISIRTLRTAADNSAASTSSHFTMHETVHAGAASFDVDASGAATSDGKTMDMTMQLPGAGALRERFVDGVFYIDMSSIPKVAAKLPPGVQWISATVDEIDSHTGADFKSLLDQAHNNGPSQGLEYLKGLSGDVQKVGDDTVNGQPATHYRAEIDFSKVPNVQALGSVADAFGKLGTQPVDVWIDDQDHVVKEHFTLDLGNIAGNSASVDMTMEINDFGVPVTVEVPPADQVIDIQAFTNSGGSTSI